MGGGAVKPRQYNLIVCLSVFAVVAAWCGSYACSWGFKPHGPSLCLPFRCPASLFWMRTCTAPGAACAAHLPAASTAAVTSGLSWGPCMRTRSLGGWASANR